MAGACEVVVKWISTRHWVMAGVGVLLCLLAPSAFVRPAAAAAGATTSVRVLKFDGSGQVLSERTVDYLWMEKNLPVLGDGTTNYYHQGPVFEGDVWDPGETVNLKDKGAVQGTDVRDLCQLVGGMSSDDEVLLLAVDNWSTRLAYANVYEPSDRQGPVVLCWRSSPGEAGGDGPGYGYPAQDGYDQAIQIVFMARTANAEGKHVFGNSDMQICLPEEKYQHYYDGLPSTNGLSGKWIDTVIICPAGSTPVVPVAADGPHAANINQPRRIPWLPIGIGGAGVLMIGAAGVLVVRRKGRTAPPVKGA